MTTFVRSAVVSGDYFCLVSYISSDGHFSVIYIYCLVTTLKSLLDVTDLSGDCLNWRDKSAQAQL